LTGWQHTEVSCKGVRVSPSTNVLLLMGTFVAGSVGLEAGALPTDRYRFGEVESAGVLTMIPGRARAWHAWARAGWPRLTRRRAARRVPAYLLASLSVGTAVLLAELTRPFIGPGVSTLFLAAVVISAWHGGLGPSLFATALAIAAKTYFFVSPFRSLADGHHEDVVQMGLFALTAVLVSWMNGTLKRAEERSARLRAREAAARAEAEAANRTKDELLAKVSHELRTPLTTTAVSSRLLRSGRRDEGVRRRALDAIDTAVRLQTRLVDDLLDAARIGAGKLSFAMRPVDPAALVRAAAEATGPAAEQAGIDLSVSLAPSIEPVLGDPDRLRQTIDNLLSNALKFTPAGGRVTVRLEGAGDRVRLTIQDTGCGFAPEVGARVFEAFWQAGAPDRGPRPGLGLGLTIVRHIVEAHGGSVRAESHGAGRGATFVVELPMLRAGAVGAPSNRITREKAAGGS
jgi:signal transduction histidine kinase